MFPVLTKIEKKKKYQAAFIYTSPLSIYFDLGMTSFAYPACWDIILRHNFLKEYFNWSFLSSSNIYFSLWNVSQIRKSVA